MRNNMRFMVFMLAFALAFSLASPVSAVLTNIQKGDTVFLGEGGLVLANNVFYTSGGVVDDQLAYFAGSNPSNGAPEYTFTPTKSSFYVDPSVFSSRTGPWYSYPNGSKNSYQSFSVQRPSLDLRLWAFRAGGNSFDITNGKIVKGEALDFRIDSNLYPIFQRTGVVAGDDGIDIKVQNPVGATFTALIDCAGTSVSIVNIHPTTQQFFLPAGTVACVWDTGSDSYDYGSYTVWAECNVNGMKDNLGSILGETITSPISSLSSTATPTPTATPILVSTASPTAEVTPEPTPTKTATPTVIETQEPVTEVQTATPTAASTIPRTAELPQTGLSPFAALISIISAALVLGIVLKKK